LEPKKPFLIFIRNEFKDAISLINDDKIDVFDNYFVIEAKNVTFDHYQYLQATIEIKLDESGQSTCEISIPHQYIVSVVGLTNYNQLLGFSKKRHT
jgi:hypothetical protein